MLNRVIARGPEEEIRHRNSEDWERNWWHLSNDEDGLDVLLGRFFEEYAQQFVPVGSRFEVSEFIECSLDTVDMTVNEMKWRMMDEGISEMEIEDLSKAAKKKAASILTERYTAAT